MNTLNVGCVVLALTSAGCVLGTESVDRDGRDGSEEVDAAEGAIKLSEIDAVPAYFGHDNRYAAADDAASIYARFTTYVGKHIAMDVRTAAGAAGTSVGFKLYRVSKNGTLKLVRAAVSTEGEVVDGFTSTGTGVYAVKLIMSGDLSDLVLHLSCAGGSCSPDPQPGEFCGGIAGVQCAKGLYCRYEPEATCGAADAGGVCAVRPDVCTEEYAPVCGCDGQTYGNACEAASNGVSVDHEGECEAPIAHVGESCGGFRIGPSPVCAEGLYCSYALEDVCGWADAPGVCAEKPEICTKEYAPVCGCDGQTYGNTCVAASNGAAILHLGECK